MPRRSTSNFATLICIVIFTTPYFASLNGVVEHLKNDLETLKAFIDRDPTLINKQNFNLRRTLLHQACSSHCNAEMVQFLLNRGANTEITDKLNQKAFDHAYDHIEFMILLHDSDTQKWTNALDIVYMLREKHQSMPRETEESYKAALHCARKYIASQIKLHPSGNQELTRISSIVDTLLNNNLSKSSRNRTRLVKSLI